MSAQHPRWRAGVAYAISPCSPPVRSRDGNGRRRTVRLDCGVLWIYSARCRLTAGVHCSTSLRTGYSCVGRGRLGPLSSRRAARGPADAVRVGPCRENSVILRSLCRDLLEAWLMAICKLKSRFHCSQGYPTQLCIIALDLPISAWARQESWFWSWWEQPQT